MYIQHVKYYIFSYFLFSNATSELTQKWDIGTQNHVTFHFKINIKGFVCIVQFYFFK